MSAGVVLSKVPIDICVPNVNCYIVSRRGDAVFVGRFVRMADAEGTLGGPSCKGKSSKGGACLDRQPQSGDLLIKAAA